MAGQGLPDARPGNPRAPELGDCGEGPFPEDTGDGGVLENSGSSGKRSECGHSSAASWLCALEQTLQPLSLAVHLFQ